jgi:hypothetical protein
MKNIYLGLLDESFNEVGKIDRVKLTINDFALTDLFIVKNVNEIVFPIVKENANVHHVGLFKGKKTKSLFAAVPLHVPAYAVYAMDQVTFKPLGFNIKATLSGGKK